MKKILIYENENEIQGAINGIQSVCFPAIEKVIKQYEGFNLGEMTSELLTDALFNNSTEIEKLFTQQAEADTATVRNPVLRQNLFNGIKEAIIEFRLSANSLTALCDRNLLKLVTIEGNAPVLADANLDKLKEMHRTYITPEEAEFYELHKKAAKALNDLFVNMKSSLVSHDILRVFVLTDGEISVPKTGINYQYFLNKEAVSE
ncbi:MAG: hypothetical protein Q8N05_02625 [Bacteroidota bacterium]|nr:hypothetical protein [Bacteroidota bacterium]